MRQLKIDNKITNRESLSLDKYLSDISKIDLLLPEEEAGLAVQIREGNEDALEKLTKSNLRFVVSVAKQYQNQGLSLSDLINEGNVGLMKAARRFDETKGFKFISYAVWWIRQSILQAIVEYSRIVRLPVNKATSYNKVQKALSSFLQEHERRPSNSELGEILDMTPDQVSKILSIGNKHVSFDAPISNDGSEATMIDIFVNKDYKHTDESLLLESISIDVLSSLEVLTLREQEILKLYFGLNNSLELNLEEIGEKFDLTRERVRQIKERALRRLRKSYNRNLFSK